MKVSLNQPLKKSKDGLKNNFFLIKFTKYKKGENMTEKLIKKIKSLPPLPESVMKVREICHDPEGSVADLVPIIKQDPTFTADILKAANSPLYGFSKEITTIDQAVSLFGMGSIEGFAVSYAMRKSVPADLSVYGINQNRLTEISEMQNALANRWGKYQVSEYKNELSTVSMLMELGKMVSAVILKENGMLEEFKTAISNAITLRDIFIIEKKFLTVPSEQIVSLIFKFWKFNPILIKMAEGILNPAKSEFKEHCKVLRVIKEAIPVTAPYSNDAINSALNKATEYTLDVGSLRQAIDELKEN